VPAAAIDKLSSEFGKLVALPDIRERLSAQGLIPFHAMPEQLAAILKADLAKYAKAIKAANIKHE
jgi:tripartite-type tricarboxylate transporter receptor subunit TctC